MSARDSLGKCEGVSAEEVDQDDELAGEVTRAIKVGDYNSRPPMQGTLHESGTTIFDAWSVIPPLSASDPMNRVRL